MIALHPPKEDGMTVAHYDQAAPEQSLVTFGNVDKGREGRKDRALRGGVL
jgi:hypothetical protein